MAAVFEKGVKKEICGEDWRDVRSDRGGEQATLQEATHESREEERRSKIEEDMLKG